MKLFSERLKNLRDTKGLTQDDLGKVLGKSRESISKYEKGNREPDLDSLASLARHFNISADYILGLKTEMNSTVNETIERYNTEKDYRPELEEYKDYLNNPDFIKFLRLAIDLKNSNLDYHDIEKSVYKMIAKQKHP